MKVEFRSSFAKDLRKIDDKGVRAAVKVVILQAEQAASLQAISDLKKIRGVESYYRIRVGSYRIGLITQENTIIFVRCLHRKDIYRYFP